MALAMIVPDEELQAFLFSCDERLEKVEFLKRAQLISLCHAQARALAHFRCTPQILPQPETVLEPIVVEIIVSERAEVGGAAAGNYCEDSESEDESEYPLGYYDESEDELEGEHGNHGHLASPEFSPSRLVQRSSLDTGFQEGGSGGLFDAAAAEFLPPTFISTGNASLSSERVGPVGDGYDDESYDNPSDDRDEHDSGGACEDDADPSDYDSGDHRDSGSGGASSGSYCGYSSGSS
ncbi:hypothetical protein CYMTET_32151 [Cymbomonas tetramitiformis]|uniref:Uncharacterized protein n=1 Tax=Cymbomonas tetramitiformis TaxID=36881 RepID=A0AAE0FFK7_9CHLO|nr:hypothetical protein CYMTET_32151 [Cymbomonas tetramitiformis]